MTTIGVVGLGYVGLPLAVAFAEAGHDVVGVDLDPRVIERLQSGHSHVEDIAEERLAEALPRIQLTTRYQRLARVDAIVLGVPTPLTANREPDLQPLLSAASQVAEHLQTGQLVVLESTTYPGTTRERLVPVLEESGLKAGRDFHVAYSPERVDPGRTDYTLRNTPKVVGGLTPECLARAIALYEPVCDELVPVSTTEAAELTKLLENIFRSVNIALVNELTILADRMGIDIREVVDAAATKPYGFMRFDPGPGMGGHCLPVDPFYLAWKAREYDLSVEFIELAGKINQQMPYYCAERAERALNDASKPVKGSKIAIIGVSYKAGVGDLRESPALKIIRILSGLGAQISYHDPHIAEIPALSLTGEDYEAALDGADLAIIVTAHPTVDHELLLERVPQVLDLRGVLHKTGARNLIRL